MNTPDPRWEELRKAVRQKDTARVKLLSMELHVTYITDNGRSQLCREAATQDVACSTCKHGVMCDAGWTGWECKLEQFRFCKPDIPTASFLWEQHPDRMPPFTAPPEPNSDDGTNDANS